MGDGGQGVDFWVKDGRLQYVSSPQAPGRAATAVKDVVKFVWLGDSGGGYLYDGGGRVGPLTQEEFCKLRPLALQVGLRVEDATRVEALAAELLRDGDQLVFRPCSARWVEGGYRHFCRPGTVVMFSEQDASDARGCHVLFPRRRAAQWTLWEDLKFFIHVGGRRAVELEGQATVSSLVDEAGRPIAVDAADFADNFTGFRAAVAERLGQRHPLACGFADVDGRACRDMQAVFAAGGRGDVTCALDREVLASLKVPPRVVQMNGQEVAFSLGEDAWHVSDLRLALARPLGHTPLAAPGFRLIDARGAPLEDAQYICEAAALGDVTVVLDQEIIAELESPSNLAVAIASKAAEGEDWGTFHSGMYAGQRQQVKLLYNYCRPAAGSTGSLSRERYDFHVYCLQEKRFVEHGRVGGD